MPRGTDLERCFGRYNPHNRECLECIFRARCQDEKRWKNIRKLKE